MDDVKLDDIRAAIAACSSVEEGSTQESRQRANGKRINLYAKLDECGSKLDQLRDVATRENESTLEIEVRRAAAVTCRSQLGLLLSHAPASSLVYTGALLRFRVVAGAFFVSLLARGVIFFLQPSVSDAAVAVAMVMGGPVAPWVWQGFQPRSRDEDGLVAVGYVQ